MRIKIATLSLALTDFVLFIACCLVAAARPPRGVPRAEQIHFVIRLSSILMLTLVSCVVTVILVFAWMRELREELLETTRQNLEALIEGTLQDHERKST